MREVVALVVVGVAACSPAPAPPPGGVGGEFVAFAPHFAGYEQWHRIDISGELPMSPHLGERRAVHVNKLPPAGADSFPVGTIVLKTSTASEEVHAMAKRGGEYNQLGARGWEWFELRRATDGSLAIFWRGITPPAGVCKTYGGIVGGACNVCHQNAAANDFVQTPGLTLTGGSPP